MGTILWVPADLGGDEEVLAGDPPALNGPSQRCAHLRLIAVVSWNDSKSVFLPPSLPSYSFQVIIPQLPIEWVSVGVAELCLEYAFCVQCKRPVERQECTASKEHTQGQEGKSKPVKFYTRPDSRPIASVFLPLR